MSKWTQFYFKGAALLLCISALAKATSCFQKTPILYTTDPVFNIEFKFLLAAVSGLEIIGALICLFSDNGLLKSIYVAWLSTCFLAYRMEFMLVGYKPCPCLGFITRDIGIPHAMATFFSLFALNYMVIGALVNLFFIVRNKHAGV